MALSEHQRPKYRHRPRPNSHSSWCAHIRAEVGASAHLNNWQEELVPAVPTEVARTNREIPNTPSPHIGTIYTFEDKGQENLHNMLPALVFLELCERYPQELATYEAEPDAL